MHPALSRTDHRPWPLPSGPWRWRQCWRDLLFAHWPVPVSALRSLVPASVAIQEFDGTSWVGVVPFRMTGVMLRPLPDVPGISAFPELNLRLYVDVGGKPGVWFISLDAASSLAVWAARRFFQTLVTSTAEVELKGGLIGRLLEPLFAAIARRMGTRSMAGLKYLVENGHAYAGNPRRLLPVPSTC